MAELQTTSQSEKALIKENGQLKKINRDLSEAMKEERLIHEHTVKKIMKQTEDLRQKLILIENGCARELVLRLKTLRDEVVTVSH